MTKKFRNKKTGDIYEVIDRPIDKNGGEQDGLSQILYRRVEQDQTYVRNPEDFYAHFEELVVDPWHPEYLEDVFYTWGAHDKDDQKWYPVKYISKVEHKGILLALVLDNEDGILTIRFDMIKRKE